MNKVILTGRLTKDPEFKQTTTGKSVCPFTLAVPKAFDKNKADFVSCVAWNKAADLMTQYCHKGMRIGIEGNLDVSSYQNQHGEMVWYSKVIVERLEFLDKSKEDNQGQGVAQPMQQTQQARPMPRQEATLGVDDDELPF